MPRRRADGNIEIKGDRVAIFYPFRVVIDNRDSWYIRSVDQWNGDIDYGYTAPFARDQFEAALLSILK
jgi:hypothetical protein